MTNAGAVVEPVLRMSLVATSGAVPLKIVNATLNPSATPLKRTRVGKRSVSSTANVPLTRARAQRRRAPAAASGSGSVRPARQ